jgi:hypothetical protein
VALATFAMTTPDDGWATDVRGAYLLRTRDGGQSWQVQLAGAEATTPPTHADTTWARHRGGRCDRGSHGATGGPGFDKCELASEEELRRWIAESPYRAVNLYIGGSDARVSE